MSAQENADKVINNQPPDNDDHQSQDENSLSPTPNLSVQYSDALSGYVARAEMQSYFDSYNPIPHGVFWITHTWGGQILPAPL